MFWHSALIFKNSLRNRRRSLLTVASIAASLCLLGVLLAVYHAFFFTEATAEQAERLITRNRVSLANPMPVAYLPRVKQVPGVREVMVSQWFGGVYKDSRDPANFFARFAAEADKLFTVYSEIKLPEAERAAFLHDRTGCIVGRKTALRHNLKVGDRVTIVGDIFPVTLELTVRGIYDRERDDQSLYFHYEYLDESLTPERRGNVGVFVVRLARAEDANAVAKGIDDLFRNSPVQTKTETEQAFQLSFLAFLGNVKLILLSICAAVTFTILLVSGNTMAMSVRERVREVGVLKTIGFTPREVLTLLVGEAIVIALVGGAVGLALAAGLCALLRQAPSGFANLSTIAVPPSVAALCLAVAALIGLVSSLVPAWGAARQSIIDALKFTD